MTDKPLATIEGTMLTPGISRNGRLYTRELIAKAVGRMQERLSDPDGLPIVMRTHHEAGDNSQLIVGRLTSVALDEKGNAKYRAALYNTGPAKDIAGLVTGKEPALKSVSIHGYWLGPVRKVSHEGESAVAGEDLEIDAVDFTASPGVVGALVTAANYTTTADQTTESATARTPISESAEVTVRAVDEVVTAVVGEYGPEPFVDDLDVYEKKFTAASRKSMAAKGQAMPGGRYPIANKSDLRNAIRAVGRGKGDHSAIRQHVIRRAKALGLSDMIPDNWASNGAMKEDAMPESPVAEASVEVSVTDDAGNQLVRVCAASCDPGVVKKAARRAGKLAAHVLDNNVDVTAGAAYDDVGGGIDDVGQANVGVSMHFHVRSNGEDLGEVKPAKHRAAPVDKDTPKDGVETEETALSEATTTAAAEAAPTGLTDNDLTKITAVIGASIKEALLAMEQARMERKTAKESKAAKESKGDKKAKTTESTETAGAENTEKAGGDTGPKEMVSVATLEQRLTAERAKTIAELRESILKDGGLPHRKGFRHVGENDTDATPTGDELWDKRSEIWAQVFPFSQAEQPVTVAAGATDA